MRVFHCDHCHHLLFFENTHCVRCDHAVAYLPDLNLVGSLDDNGDGTWRSPLPAAAGRVYRLCKNYTTEQVCNWAVPQAGAEPTGVTPATPADQVRPVAEQEHDETLCFSCRLTRVIPDLALAGHREAWYQLEIAKRRLLFTLISLQLPITSREEDPKHGLAFEFKTDAPDRPVMTGHSNGVITINVSEADAAERAKRKKSLNEPYRTLAGHFRHESGHHYWDVLVRDTAWLAPFRERFGDDSADYGEALQKYYANGPAPDWATHSISAYATAHPLEDWAETWAHYLHIVDTLETAAACGFSLHPQRSDEPSLSGVPAFVVSSDLPFDQLIDGWFPLTYALNNLTRGLGFEDPYPFVLSPASVEKLRFVHDVVCKKC